MGRTFSNLKNQTFGRLTVISKLDNDCHKQVVWKCKCSCGKICSVISRSLVHNRTKSCGCLHSDSVRKIPYYHLFTSMKRRSKRVNRICSLTFDEFLEFIKTSQCHYCGDKVTWWKHNDNGNKQRYNLDRKNNGKGYTKQNCVVCCPRCNRMKGSLTYDEFYEFTLPIRQSRKTKCSCDSSRHECCDICTGYAEAERNGTLKDKE